MLGKFVNRFVGPVIDQIVLRWIQPNFGLAMGPRTLPQLIFPRNRDVENAADEEAAPANSDINSLLDLTILQMAVPKSKTTPQRKKQGHERFVPDRVNWVKCERCGEPKRPHRFCSKQISICAMRDDEFAAHNGGATAAPATPSTSSAKSTSN